MSSRLCRPEKGAGRATTRLYGASRRPTRCLISVNRALQVNVFHPSKFYFFVKKKMEKEEEEDDDFDANIDLDGA